ncbi:hypothetical protein [Brucella intermedia]|uniref:hypothetical protein n=1 Tax=Brucella intermedia TaxID=94625 RepID=UPI0012DA62E4|nr:hypothetical protein [Brucella intermedia]
MDEKEQIKAKMEAAERAHVRRSDALSKHGDHVLSYSNAAMKAPALASVGGIAALLGFYSANYTRLSEKAEVLATLNDILFWLFLSLLLTVVAPGLSYFNQLAYVSSMSKETYHYDHPYIRDTKASKWYERLGDFMRILAILTVISSIGCLMRGGYLFLKIV